MDSGYGIFWNVVTLDVIQWLQFIYDNPILC